MHQKPDASELIVRATLRGAGALVSELAIAPWPGGAMGIGASCTLTATVVDPTIDDLIWALQARYDLAW